LDLHLLLWTPTTGNRRLTEVKETNAQGVVVLDEQFVYDVNDHLIGEAVNGVPQRWTVYDGSTPYLDLTGAGQVSERYLADPNALAMYWARVGVTGQADWMVTDLLGSVRELVSAGGSVEDQINYDAYGNVVSETNAAAGGRLKYAGGQYDGGLGLTLFGARWYNSAAGRWLSQDPLGLGPDSNPYRYVGNGPTDGTDPSGLVLLDNRERLRTAYAEAMRLQNAYAQANGHAPPLTEAQIQAYSTQAAQGGVYDYEPNPLYNDFWARAYQCEVQIFSDAVPFARGFVAGVGSGAWSFGEGVANLIRGLPGSVGQIIEGITNLIGALVELRWDAAARQAFPDLYRLVSEWSSVGAYDKGYLAGRVVGQYGAAVLTGMGVSRILGMVRRAVGGAASAAEAAGAAVGAEAEAASGGAGPVAVGQQGLQAAGITQNTTRIPSLTGTAAYRIPDGLNHTTRVISEVKNVSSLSYTNQLRDYVLWAQANNYTFELWVRPTTILSGPLQQAVSNGQIVLRFLP
jgi:RHS repeat-associated protein